MKNAFLTFLFTGICVITVMSCANESVTSPSNIEVGPLQSQANNTITQPTSGVDPRAFTCESVQEVEARFSDPGFVDDNHVGFYLSYTGVPSAGDKFFRIWWDYDGHREKHQDIDVGTGEVQRNNDDLYDVKAVVEHTYERLDGPKKFKVRVELILEGGDRGCARSRNVKVAPVPVSPAPGPSGPGCGGWSHGGACWYTSPKANMSCKEVCASHGGFDVEGSRHTGNEIGKHFYPDKKDGFDWESVECSSTDNNTNWGANGWTPDPDWKNGACYVSCACNQ